MPPLEYAAPQLRRDLELLELSDELLEELQRRGADGGGGLALKGAPGDEAVLCGRDATYAVKRVETTNLVLLVHPEGGAAAALGGGGAAAAVTAVAACSSHLEAARVPPRLEGLDRALQNHTLRGDGGPVAADDATAVDGGGGDAAGLGCAPGPRWPALLRAVQASAGELAAALPGRGVVEVGGRYYKVDPELEGHALELLLLTGVEAGWPAAGLEAPEGAAVAALAAAGVPPAAARWVLARYAVGARPLPAPPGAPTHWRLDGRAVALHFARRLLAARPAWERADEFDAAWAAALPEGVAPPGRAALAGLALATPGGGLRRFAADELPRAPAARFAALFAERPAWEAADVEPYVADLCAPGQTVEALLLAHARASQARPTDAVTYSARARLGT